VRGVGPGSYRAGVVDMVLVSGVLPGDEISEVDSPGGPWYRVLAVEPGTGTVTVGAEPGLVVVVAVGRWETDAVLRRVPPLEAALRAGARPLVPGE